jgi:hypothetical protein
VPTVLHIFALLLVSGLFLIGLLLHVSDNNAYKLTLYSSSSKYLQGYGPVCGRKARGTLCVFWRDTFGLQKAALTECAPASSPPQ